VADLPARRRRAVPSRHSRVDSIVGRVGRGANIAASRPKHGMQTITLIYDSHTAALASRERFWLALHIPGLPDGDPTKRFVTFMALYARDVLTGELPGPYSDERARSFARLALVEPGAYRPHRRRGDIELAGVLGLPVIEIPHVRREQQALAQPRPGTRRTRSRPDFNRRRARPARR